MLNTETAMRRSEGTNLPVYRQVRSGSQYYAHDRYGEEDQTESDGSLVHGFLHTTTGLVDRAIAPKHTAQPAGFCLEHDNSDEGNGDYNLNDVYVK